MAFKSSDFPKKVKLEKKLNRVFKFFGLLFLAAFIVLCIFAYRAGIFTDPEVLEDFVSKAGFWGPLVFVLIQIVQVILPVIPGGITFTAGVIMFGAVKGFIVNFIGCTAGSVINFLLARKYGKRLVKAMVSQKTYDKYVGWLDKGRKFEKFFFIAIFLPVAPDDFLCMLAGLTDMSFKRFITLFVIGKPFSLILYSIGTETIKSWIAGIFG